MVSDHLIYRNCLCRSLLVWCAITEVMMALEAHAVPVNRAEVGASGRSVGVVRLYPTDQHVITQVRVVADGSTTPLSARVLWSAVGQPTDVIFDARGGTPITITTGIAGSGAWDPPDGLMLETRQRANGEIASWADFQQVWKNSQPIQGRSLVPHVFDGLNRHGPNEDFCSLYSGWLRVEQAGDYVVATVSDDGSWLFIDEKLVCAWPGWHGPEDGMRGKYSASVRLSAGRHRFTYAHVQGSGGTVAEAAWKPPGAERFQVIPPEAFGLTARYQVDRVSGEPLAFSWVSEGHCRVADQTLVTMRLRTVANTSVVWRCVPMRSGQAGKPDSKLGPNSDQLTAEGADVRVVLSPGRWQIWAGDQQRAIDLTPVWGQIDDWDDTRWAAQRAELVARRMTMPLVLMSCALRMAKMLDDPDLTTRITDALLARLKAGTVQIPEGAGAEVGWIAQRLQAADVRRYADAATVFTAAVATPNLAPEIADHLRLHWAGLLLHVFGDGPAGGRLLQTIERTHLDDGERRLLSLYQADARLAQGDVSGCRQLVLAIADAVDPADTGYALRRRARLERAHDLLLRGEWDAAEVPLREIEWETPRERLGTETAALLIQVWLGRGELPMALTRCRLVALSAADDQRLSDILLLQVKVQLAGGDRDGARATIVRLKKDYPFSEAAARLHDIHIPEKP